MSQAQERWLKSKNPILSECALPSHAESLHDRRLVNYGDVPYSYCHTDCVCVDGVGIVSLARCSRHVQGEKECRVTLGFRGCHQNVGGTNRIAEFKMIAFTFLYWSRDQYISNENESEFAGCMSLTVTNEWHK